MKSLMNQRRQQRAAGHRCSAAITYSPATVVIIALLLIPPILGINVGPLTGQRGRAGCCSRVRRPEPGEGLPFRESSWSSRTSTAWATWSTSAEDRQSGRGRDTAHHPPARSGRCRLVRAQWRDSAGSQPVAGDGSVAAVDIPVAYDREPRQGPPHDRSRRRGHVRRPVVRRQLLLGRPTYAGVKAVSGEAVVFIEIIAKAAPEKQIPLTRSDPGADQGRFRPRGYPGADGRATFPPGAAGQPPAQ